MADPVSSVAYAVEAALRELDGDPASLFAAMAVVVGIIFVVSLTYHQLIGRFPQGGEARKRSPTPSAKAGLPPASAPSWSTSPSPWPSAALPGRRR